MFGIAPFADIPFASVTSRTAVVVVIGVSATASSNSVLIWTQINDSQTTNWVVVSDSQAGGWVQIVDGNAVNWVEIPT
jgi:hypothetical protein